MNCSDLPCSRVTELTTVPQRHYPVCESRFPGQWGYFSVSNWLCLHFYTQDPELPAAVSFRHLSLTIFSDHLILSSTRPTPTPLVHSSPRAQEGGGSVQSPGSLPQQPCHSWHGLGCWAVTCVRIAWPGGQCSSIQLPLFISWLLGHKELQLSIHTQLINPIL